jgi:hypothetical protein
VLKEGVLDHLIQVRFPFFLCLDFGLDTSQVLLAYRDDDIADQVGLTLYYYN